MKEYMITIIRQHWFYEAGVLETMSEGEVYEIYDRLIDWIYNVD